MTVTIWHNPACGTSRNTLAMIRAIGIEPLVVEYLKTPPSREKLTALIAAAGLTTRGLLRQKGTPYAELGLDDPALGDGALLDAMLAHPILINRPLVETPLGTRLCRPSEIVLDILPAPLAADFAKEDGEGRAGAVVIPLSRRAFAEGLGAMLLFACVIGSGIMAQRLAGGNDAIALLGNTLATAAMLLVLVSVLGPVSGAHMNPAVTLVAVLRRDLSGVDGLGYVAAQLGGGLLGVLLAHAMFDLPLWQLGSMVRSGTGQWLSEGVATFALVLAILGGVRHRPGSVPVIVAAVITAGYWFTASTSFANPAITLARALTDSFSGIRPVDAPAFILAQLTGACVASSCANKLFSNPS